MGNNQSSHKDEKEEKIKAGLEAVKCKKRFEEKMKGEESYRFYESSGSKQINVVCCGRSLNWAHTALSVLDDPCFSPEGSDLLGKSGRSECYARTFSFVDEALVGKTIIRFLVFPEEVDRKHVEEMVETVGELGMKEINVLLYFCSFVSGVNAADVEAVRELVSGLFPKRIALVVTNSEKMLGKKKQQMIDQLKKEKTLFGLFSERDLRVHFLGAVHPENYSNSSELITSYKRVANMRTSLLRYLTVSGEKEKVAPRDEIKRGFEIQKVPVVAKETEAVLGMFPKTKKISNPDIPRSADDLNSFSFKNEEVALRKEVKGGFETADKIPVVAEETAEKSEITILTDLPRSTTVDLHPSSND